MAQRSTHAFLNLARAKAFAVVLTFAFPGLALAAPADDFAAACVARGQRESACACQAKLARAGLTSSERRAAIAGLRGGQPAMAKAVAAMGEARAKVFGGKMHALGKRAQAECR